MFVDRKPFIWLWRPVYRRVYQPLYERFGLPFLERLTQCIAMQASARVLAELRHVITENNRTLRHDFDAATQQIHRASLQTVEQSAAQCLSVASSVNDLAASVQRAREELLNDLQQTLQRHHTKTMTRLEQSVGTLTIKLGERLNGIAEESVKQWSSLEQLFLASMMSRSRMAAREEAQLRVLNGELLNLSLEMLKEARLGELSRKDTPLPERDLTPLPSTTSRLTQHIALLTHMLHVHEVETVEDLEVLRQLTSKMIVEVEAKRTKAV